jgi:competence protein ComEA
MKMLKFIAASALAIALATSAYAQSSQPTPSNRSTTPPPATAAPSKPSTAPSTQSSTTEGGLVDINSASKEELGKLKGVGPARADAIVQNRPYRAKTELQTKKVIPENVYKDIQDKIIAKQGTASSTSSGSSTVAPTVPATGAPAKKQ